MPWLLEGRSTFSWSVAIHRRDDDKVMAISSDVLGGHNNGIVEARVQVEIAIQALLIAGFCILCVVLGADNTNTVLIITAVHQSASHLNVMNIRRSQSFSHDKTEEPEVSSKSSTNM